MEGNVEPGDNRVSKKKVFGIVKEGSEGDGWWIREGTGVISIWIWR